MEYTPYSFTAQLNPCDYDHSDLPYIRVPSSKKKRTILSSKQLDKIKLIRQHLESGLQLSKSIKAAQISPSSYYEWLEKYHLPDRLKNYLEVARKRCEDNRNVDVEDAFLIKLKAGEGSGSEYEFFLCNRLPERWKKLKDNTVVVQNTINNEVNKGANSGTFTGEDAELVEIIRAQLIPKIPAQ